MPGYNDVIMADYCRLDPHSEAILEAAGPEGRLLALDRDGEAVELAGRRLERFGERAKVVRASFAENLW